MNAQMAGNSGNDVEFTLENNAMFGRLVRPLVKEMRNGSINAS
jgi:hypothetical protein